MNHALITEERLSRSEANAVARFAAGVRENPYEESPEAYDAVLRPALGRIPNQVAALAADFGRRLGEAGVLRLRNIPLPPNLPPTPDTVEAGLVTRSAAEPILLGLAALAGKAVAFAGWRGGQRVHNVFPVIGDAGTQKASNAVRLEMHTEVAFSPECPDALAILYVRNGDERAPATAFCDLRACFQALDADDRQRLSEPAFFVVGRSADGGEHRSETQPVAAGPRFTYIPGLSGATQDHDGALRRLEAEIEANTVELTMTPGDLVLIDNTHVVHGRTRFQPRFDGSDRWLQRCLIRRAQG